MNEIYDYLDAGFRVFGIYGVDEHGNCECGNEDCQALFKHPRIARWQNVPQWSDEQLDVFEQMGHFRTGFGVLCDGYLIIDVDARNGGVESFKRLVELIPDAGKAAFVVNTGSGGGSQHHYFRMPEKMALVQHHDDYPGIDFKTSGYVIGCGSMHASGSRYEQERGYPQDITDAPKELLDLLKKPERHRVTLDGSAIDVSEQDIAKLLQYIDPNMPYEPWIKTGMAIHHCLAGGGFELWDSWSSSGDSYPGTDQLARHWHSFGKSANPAGYGTLLHYAREGGYVEEVTFEYSPPVEHASSEDPLDPYSVDILRPPGFVGELTQWINDQCLYPRETLAVATALTAVSSLAGMRHVDEMDDISPNLIAFCVAGSSTGKEAVQQAYLKIMREAGVQAAVHGGFKSEQEIMRNLIRHQAAFYSIDELGLVLRKLENASKRGGASYLEGIIGLIMSVYSKANGYLPITGDLKEEIREHLRKELSSIDKRIDDLPADSSADGKRSALEREHERILEALDKIDDGLDSPYLTILGYTTPVTFDSLMGFEQATNGFLARAMIFYDLETNPRRKPKFKKRPMDERMKVAIRNLYSPGSFDMTERAARVEWRGEKTVVPTTPEAADLMNEVYERFYEMAEEQKGATGLEAIPRRGYELAAKVSMILAMPEGLRTAEHVRWAYALAKRDVERKIQLAYSTEHEDKDNGIAAKILSLLDCDHGETEGVILNRLRRQPKEQVKAVLQAMVDRGSIRREECLAANHRACVRYYKCK